MVTKYLSNAFSLNMILTNQERLVRITPVKPEDVPADCESAIGHPDTARVVSGILGREILPNRMNVTIMKGDVLFVAQYKGPRLPEGTTVLPEGASLEFLKVELV